MTENKRFTLKVSRKNNEVKIIDNHNDNLTLFSVSYVTFDDTLLVRNHLKPVVDLLNELHEDNQLLHKMNAEAIDFMYDNFDLNIMFTDRELNNICNEQGLELSEKGIKINQLEKKNELLKLQYKELEISLLNNQLAYIDLEKENEELKAQLKDCEHRITDKEVEWLRENTVWEQMPSSKRTFTKTTKE